MRPTLLAAALLAIGLQATDAQALGLGGLRVRSALGEPFRAEVSLIGSGESTPASTCFSVGTPPSIGADDLPWLGSGRIRIQGHTLYISSTAVNEPILMVGLRVGCGFEVSRDYTVLLQPEGSAPEEAAVAATPLAAATPADAARPARAARTPRAEASARTDEAAAQSAQAEPARPARKAKPKRSDGSGDRLFVAPGLDSGALKMSGGMGNRPEATEAQREALRSEQKLLAALDEQIATHLAIADKVKHLEARLAELQKQLDRSGAALDATRAPAAAAPPPVQTTPTAAPAAEQAPTTADTSTPPAEPAAPPTPEANAPAAEPPPPAPGLTNEPAKIVTKLPPDSAPQEEPVVQTGGVDWMVAGLGLAAAGAVLGGGMLWRRRTARLAEARARRQQELEARLAEQQQTTRRREQRAADNAYAQGDDEPSFEARTPFSGARTEAARTSPFTPAVQLTPPPAPTNTATVSSHSNAVDEVASIEHFPGEAPAEHMENMAIAAPPPDTPAAEPPSVSATVPDLEFTPAAVSSVDFELGTDSDVGGAATSAPARLDLEFDTFVGSASSTGSAGDTAPAQGPRLVSSQASIPIDQSAQSANEEEAPSHEHVLELAEIMMSFGRAEGAAQTLSDFLRDYPKESLVPWLKLLDLYHKGGRRGEYDDLAPKLNRAFNVKVPQWEEFTGPITSESVEQFAHIMARVNATWPGQDCLDYLTELLRDNRAGTRIGFPLGVIDDILLLKSMLEWLIANPPLTNTSASRLALL